jgi:hypothetical protein
LGCGKILPWAKLHQGEASAGAVRVRRLLKSLCTGRLYQARQNERVPGAARWLLRWVSVCKRFDVEINGRGERSCGTEQDLAW